MPDYYCVKFLPVFIFIWNFHLFFDWFLSPPIHVKSMKARILLCIDRQFILSSVKNTAPAIQCLYKYVKETHKCHSLQQWSSNHSIHSVLWINLLFSLQKWFVKHILYLPCMRHYARFFRMNMDRIPSMSIKVHRQVEKKTKEIKPYSNYVLCIFSFANEEYKFYAKSRIYYFVSESNKDLLIYIHFTEKKCKESRLK